MQAAMGNAKVPTKVKEEKMNKGEGIWVNCTEAMALE
jgi:hypothetical protein